MENEKKGQEEPKKLSYEELSQTLSDLHVQYQKLEHEYMKAMKALNDREFDYMSFFLQMLFKVVEHKQAYKFEFAKWATDNIQNILTSFGNSLQTMHTDENHGMKEENQVDPEQDKKGE